MDDIRAVKETTMLRSTLAATQGIYWEETAPGPVSPLGSGQAHNQPAIVSCFVLRVFGSKEWTTFIVHM